MSTIKANTLQNVAASKSAAVADVVDGYAKAWVNFNGTGTVAIRAAFNVSSITDNGAGDYTVNFTNALADANYSISGIAYAPGVSDGILGIQSGSGLLPASARLITINSAGALGDKEFVMASFFR